MFLSSRRLAGSILVGAAFFAVNVVFMIGIIVLVLLLIIVAAFNFSIFIFIIYAPRRGWFSTVSWHLLNVTLRCGRTHTASRLRCSYMCNCTSVLL